MSKFISAEDFWAWLAEHGIDYRDVQHIEFTPDSETREAGRLCMKVHRMARNGNGEYFLDQTATEPVPATEVVWVPVRRLP